MLEGTLPPPPAPPPPTLSDFAIISKLGSGDVSTVYLATLLRGGPKYALKVVSLKVLVERDKFRRLRTELKVLMSTDHPYIIPMYHAYTTNTHVIMVLGYMSGGTLFEFLCKQPSRRVSEDVARFVALQVSQAIEYLHLNGFVYRDLKPENILLRIEGGGCNIVLTDFDLSLVDEVACAVQVSTSRGGVTAAICDGTRSKSFVGTPEYMAPEVVTGVGHGRAVDWWGLGVLIYEMLCGFTPFNCGGSTNAHRSDADVYRAISGHHGDVVYPPDLTVSPEARALIRNLLQPKPSMRLGCHGRGSDDVVHNPWMVGGTLSCGSSSITGMCPLILRHAAEKYESHFMMKIQRGRNVPVVSLADAIAQQEHHNGEEEGEIQDPRGELHEWFGTFVEYHRMDWPRYVPHRDSIATTSQLHQQQQQPQTGFLASIKNLFKK
eukprot:PhF_6_TR40639/c0_g1_i1/m.61009